MTRPVLGARCGLRCGEWLIRSLASLALDKLQPSHPPQTFPLPSTRRLRWPTPSVWQICHHLCSLACMRALFHAGDNALLEPGPSDKTCFHTDCVRWKVRRTISALTDNKDCCSSVNTQPPRFYFSPTTACPFCSVTNRGKPSVRACCIA